MAKFKVTYNHGFSTHDENIEADSLEEAKELVDIKSVYRDYSIEEIFDNLSLNSAGKFPSVDKMKAFKPWNKKW